MVRAGVFIGVDKTGNLQTLNDAAAGAKRMYEWARQSQGFPDTNAKLITDADGARVTPDRVYDSICEIINGAGVDQLIVYFAGHGVNINRSEYWLLTDAPVRANAAVDLAGTVELARYCGISHVVFISDACRVAPEGIQAQQVRGSDIFPNESASDKAKPVDQFFACVLGRTAAEVKDPAAAAGGFCAIYTNTLLDALKGQRAEVLDASDSAHDPSYYVKPVKLETYLEREVPARIRSLNLVKKVNQSPDAILTAHSYWIAKVETAPRIVRTARRIVRKPPAPPPVAPDLRTLSRSLIQTAVEGAPEQLTRHIEMLKGVSLASAAGLAETAESVAEPFGPDSFETQCGVKVRGSHITQFALARGRAELLRPDVLQIEPDTGPTMPSSLLLRFHGNTGTLIPAVPGYLAALTFEGGELVDVAYEPSANTGLWHEYKDKSQELRRLRGVAAAASHHGRFRLDNVGDPLEVARKMQYSKAMDPTLAVYAAYAYHDLQQIDRIRDMAGYIRMSLNGMTLFDLALLGRTLVDRRVDREQWLVPFAPLFSQGWHLLSANHVRLHPALEGIERTMHESVWSLFEGEGVNQLERALRSGEVW